jgi:putative sigma-54 modulation protein
MQVILTQEKHRHKAEVLLKADALSITGQEETTDSFSSIDAVVDNLERQLKKQKRKKNPQKHKSSHEDMAWRYQMQQSSAEGPEEGSEPEVIVSRNVFAKPMSLEEAVMQMRVSENEFIVFTDSSNEKISVLYRRKDGNFGLIEPEIP